MGEACASVVCSLARVCIHHTGTTCRLMWRVRDCASDTGGGTTRTPSICPSSNSEVASATTATDERLPTPEAEANPDLLALTFTDWRRARLFLEKTPLLTLAVRPGAAQSDAISFVLVCPFRHDVCRRRRACLWSMAVAQHLFQSTDKAQKKTAKRGGREAPRLC